MLSVLMNKFKRHLSLIEALPANPISFNISEQLISFIAFLISPPFLYTPKH